MLDSVVYTINAETLEQKKKHLESEVLTVELNHHNALEPHNTRRTENSTLGSDWLVFQKAGR